MGIASICYTFRLKATDPYGNWMDEEQQLLIRRLPAWYETWYAYSFYTLFIVCIICLLFYAYTKRMEKKNKPKKRQGERFKKLQI